jgi:hypothetical protein
MIENSSVIRLSLSWRMGLQDLGGLIDKCPNLQVYSHHYYFSPLESPRPRDLYPALLHAKHTLRVIWIEIEPEYAICNGDEWHWPSFNEFTALLFLHVPISILGQFTSPSPEEPTVNLPAILPPSIENLDAVKVGISAILPLLPTLLRYAQPPQVCSCLTELRTATITYEQDEGDPIQTAIKTLSLTTDLAELEISSPILEHVVRLHHICGLRINFNTWNVPWKSLDRLRVE